MNRRGFLSSMLKAGAAFAILPPALTYSRHWQPTTAPTKPETLETLCEDMSLKNRIIARISAFLWLAVYR